ncbi:hypothetical protein NJI34_44020, partial [Pseudomonas sp. S 311-6]|nr:hypothetical protein [Pseudomonas sp. S 311-6]
DTGFEHIAHADGHMNLLGFGLAPHLHHAPHGEFAVLRTTQHPGGTTRDFRTHHGSCKATAIARSDGKIGQARYSTIF